MESPDLTPPLPDEDRLDAWLRTQAAVPPLPDAGFTARVLAALPPTPGTLVAARHREARRRGWLCLAGAGAGMLLAGLAGHGAPGTGLGSALAASASSFVALGARLATPEFALAVVATAASLAIVYWPALLRLRRFAE